MHDLLRAMITDLRSAEAIVKLIKEQDPEIGIVCVPIHVHDKICQDMNARYNWHYSVDTLRWCLSVDKVWIEIE